MAERPLILFGTPTDADRKKKSGFPSNSLKIPTHERQASRMAPKMDALRSTLLTMQATASGIEPEKTLVFELAKDVNDFYTAVKNLGDDIELILDFPEEFSASDDFFVTKEIKSSKDRVRDEDKKVFGGKVYCVVTNARALQEIISLWDGYSKDSSIKFPHGKGGLKHVFDCLLDIRPWGYKERIEETGILEAWTDDLNFTDAPAVKCEIELFYRNSSDARKRSEEDLVTRVSDLGGVVLSSSTIEQIAYHAILVELPRQAVQRIIDKDENVALIVAEQIMFFRPTGQAIYLQDGDTSDQTLDIQNDEEYAKPIVALFDGLPQGNHPLLNGRLVIDDPDNYSASYTVADRKHGTSMASLILHGDLSGGSSQTSRKIYCRPILQSKSGLNTSYEEVPDNILFPDKIHEAVRRLFFSPDGGEGVSSGIKVINLSIGIAYRLFDRSMSPLARLLDWLSYEYNVLFVVSAGNHAVNINTKMTFSDFSKLSLDSRDEIVIKWLNENARNTRLLSPAESINALTVGAFFDDKSVATENAIHILPCSSNALNPASALGGGLNRSIKPDIIYSGGRAFVQEDIKNQNNLRWVLSQQKPGTKSASPASPTDGAKTVFSFGTSNAAALVSHEAARCYDVLMEIFNTSDKNAPMKHMALLLKAMLIHGAEWGNFHGTVPKVLGYKSRSDYSDRLHRFIGYGKPDIDKAIECTKKRITLIGYGELGSDNAHIYELPLPFNFSKEKIMRRLTITLVGFAPILPARQAYKELSLSFDVDDEGLINGRIDANDKAVRRGTVQHEIFENDEAVVWSEDNTVKIKVNCRATISGSKTEKTMPYAIFVSFEVKSNIDIDVYGVNFNSTFVCKKLKFTTGKVSEKVLMKDSPITPSQKIQVAPSAEEYEQNDE